MCTYLDGDDLLQGHEGGGTGDGRLGKARRLRPQQHAQHRLAACRRGREIVASFQQHCQRRHRPQHGRHVRVCLRRHSAPAHTCHLALMPIQEDPLMETFQNLDACTVQQGQMIQSILLG